MMVSDSHIFNIIEVPCDMLSIHQTAIMQRLLIVWNVPPRGGQGGICPDVGVGSCIHGLGSACK